MVIWFIHKVYRLHRSGLTSYSGPSREDRMIPINGTLICSWSWNNDTKFRKSI